jgi:hypothetical protein
MPNHRKSTENFSPNKTDTVEALSSLEANIARLEAEHEKKLERFRIRMTKESANEV